MKQRIKDLQIQRLNNAITEGEYKEEMSKLQYYIYTSHKLGKMDAVSYERMMKYFKDGNTKMDRTMETLKDMLNIGMIDQAEYEEERNHYYYLITAVQEFKERIQEKKLHMESIKMNEKKTDDPRIEKLYELYVNGIITDEEFKRIHNSLQ